MGAGLIGIGMAAGLAAAGGTLGLGGGAVLAGLAYALGGAAGLVTAAAIWAAREDRAGQARPAFHPRNA